MNFLKKFSLSFVLVAGVFSAASSRAVDVYGKVGVALGAGLALSLIEYWQDNAQAEKFLYAPSPTFQDLFDQEIVACGLDPKTVKIRYGYSDRVLDLYGSTIVINPLVWIGLEGDVQAEVVKQALEVYVVAPASPVVGELLKKTRALMTPGAQKFMFRQVLGSFKSSYMVKKAALDGALNAGAIGASFAVADRFIAPRGTFVYWATVMVSSEVLDALSKLLFDPLFRSYMQRQADMFAVEHSTSEEIEAAAVFFEGHYAALNEYFAATGATPLPSFLRFGLRGVATRVAHLRSLAQEKRLTQANRV